MEEQGKAGEEKAPTMADALRAGAEDFDRGYGQPGGLNEAAPYVMRKGADELDVAYAAISALRASHERMREELVAAESAINALDAESHERAGERARRAGRTSHVLACKACDALKSVRAALSPPAPGGGGA